MEHIASGYQAWLDHQQPLIIPLRNGLAKLGLTMGDAIFQLRAAYEERIKLYPKLQAQVLPLAQRGWFLSGAMGLSDLLALAEVCGSISDAELDAHVAALYRDDIANQMDSILREHPCRAFALQPALDAHQRGEYALSVPIFFAHSDGICFEEMKRELFLKQGTELREVAKDELLALQSSDPNSLRLLKELMWMPLSAPLPIGYSKTERGKHNYTGLNRNTVLHGLALAEYATEENSLKAFSMLSYITSLVSQHKDSAIGAPDAPV